MPHDESNDPHTEALSKPDPVEGDGREWDLLGTLRQLGMAAGLACFCIDDKKAKTGTTHDERLG